MGTDPAKKCTGEEARCKKYNLWATTRNNLLDMWNQRNTTQLYLPNYHICYIVYIRGWDGVVNKKARLWADWQRNCSSDLQLRQCVLHAQNIQTNTGAHQASYLVGCRGNVPSAKSRHETDHSPIFSAKVMNCWSYTSTTSHTRHIQKKKRLNFAIKTLLLILQHFKRCPIQQNPLYWRYTVPNVSSIVGMVPGIHFLWWCAVLLSHCPESLLWFGNDALSKWF